jgi:hypothetical protein
MNVSFLSPRPPTNQTLQAMLTTIVPPCSAPANSLVYDSSEASDLCKSGFPERCSRCGVNKGFECRGNETLAPAFARQIRIFWIVRG